VNNISDIKQGLCLVKEREVELKTSFYHWKWPVQTISKCYEFD